MFTQDTVRRCAAVPAVLVGLLLAGTGPAWASPPGHEPGGEGAGSGNGRTAGCSHHSEGCEPGPSALSGTESTAEETAKAEETGALKGESESSLPVPPLAALPPPAPISASGPDPFPFGEMGHEQDIESSPPEIAAPIPAIDEAPSLETMENHCFACVPLNLNQ